MLDLAARYPTTAELLSYILEGSKADQIAGIGNSVVPQVMAALVRANMGGA